MFSRVSSRRKRNFNIFYMTHASNFFTIVRVLLWPVISLAKHSFRSTGPRSINCLSRVLGRPRVPREIFTGSQCGFMSVCILKTSERRDTMLILTAGEARKRGWLLPGVRSLIYHCPLKYRAGTNTRGINRRRLIHGAGQVERWHILTFPTTHEGLYIQKARYGEEMVGKKSYSGSHFPFS